jgi:hypothetical protein
MKSFSLHLAFDLGTTIKFGEACTSVGAIVQDQIKQRPRFFADTYLPFQNALNNKISFNLFQSSFCRNPQIHASEPSPKKS